MKFMSGGNSTEPIGHCLVMPARFKATTGRKLGERFLCKRDQIIAEQGVELPVDGYLHVHVSEPLSS